MALLLRCSQGAGVEKKVMTINFPTVMSMFYYPEFIFHFWRAYRGRIILNSICKLLVCES